MRLGTPLSPTALKVMLLGSGELGKEVAIELQRLGVEVIAVDRYAGAPAQQVAHRAQTRAGGEGGRGGQDWQAQLAGHHPHPGHVVAVLVGDDDGREVTVVQAGPLQAAEKLAAGEPAIHQHRLGARLHQDGVAPGAAGQQAEA
jgi:predicted dinucleotide-binding enzyme